MIKITIFIKFKFRFLVSVFFISYFYAKNFLQFDLEKAET